MSMSRKDICWSEYVTHNEHWKILISCLDCRVDVILRNGQRHLDVVIEALSAGKGALRSETPPKRVPLCNGDECFEVDYDDIQYVIPQPATKATPEKLRSVDLNKADAMVGNSGYTIRQVNELIYRPVNDAERELFLRRQLAKDITST